MISLTEFRRAISDRNCELRGDPPGLVSLVFVRRTGHLIPATVQSQPSLGLGQIDYVRWIEEVDADLLVPALTEEISPEVAR